MGCWWVQHASCCVHPLPEQKVDRSSQILDRDTAVLQDCCRRNFFVLRHNSCQIHECPSLFLPEAAAIPRPLSLSGVSAHVVEGKGVQEGVLLNGGKGGGRYAISPHPRQMSDRHVWERGLR